TGSRAAITVQANDGSSGESVTMTIPVSAVPANGDPVNATATLEASGTTILMPADGFTSYDGTSTDVTVGVNSTRGLGRLAINGTNVLASLRASSGTSNPSAPPRSGQPPAAPSGSQPSGG